MRTIVQSICGLAESIDRLVTQLSNVEVISRLSQLESNINMKLSEIKTQIASASANSTEAFNELSTRIADLQKQVEDLLAGVGDPEVTDEAFLADLNALRDNTAALAAIVPNVPPVS